RSGFTLIEVLVTMALMGVVLPVVLNALSSAQFAASYARHSVEAATLGQRQLNQMIGELYTTGADTAGSSGTFDEIPGYTWQGDEELDTDLNLYTVTVKVTWQDRGQEQNVLLSSMVVPPP